MVAKKGERSQMVGLLEMFTVKYKNLFCKNQDKNNLLIKKNMYNINIFQIIELCKSWKIFLINKVLKFAP